MSTTSYDIAIIGAGAAGLHLAMAMCKDDYFKDQSILLLDKDDKNKNDRTWCFWEKGAGQWDHLLAKSWKSGWFFAEDKAIELSLAPYAYKMLPAIEFYNNAKKIIQASPNISWQKENVNAVIATDAHFTINGQQSIYQATYVFDSRIPQEFHEEKGKATFLLQPFKGWFIETNEDYFETDQFTMMDYRLLWKDTTSFTYVLPITKRKALIEYTFFTPRLIEEAAYDQMLKKYIREILKIKDYKILEVEQGVIPMSNFPFEKYNRPNHIRIGTAGGWVKPSSGYAFKNCEKKAATVVQNFKNGIAPDKGLINKRFRLYDAVLLDVLYRKNELGPSIFLGMYGKNPIQDIFAFLDEESKLGTDIKMLSRFDQFTFTQSLINHLMR